tara:strand:+ start:1136 stop:1939 length:804 start_codon:yes stop_codon:yes gene_type:complete
METVYFFGYLGALFVGIILGIMGSGGSIIAIPIFTYLFHISPVATTAYSLFVVGVSASIGVVRNWRKGLVDLRVALVFAIPAFLMVFLVRKYMLPIIPRELFTIKDLIITKDMMVMVLLAFTMLLCSLSMLRKKKLQVVLCSSQYRYNYLLIMFQGLLIGLFTGILGIGGGFLIIPTLVLLIKLPIKKAVATSLFIIAIKSLVGFVGDLGNHKIDWAFLFAFTLVSVLGIFLGIYLSTFINGEKLKKLFGWMLLFIALGVFYFEFFY